MKYSRVIRVLSAGPTCPDKHLARNLLHLGPCVTSRLSTIVTVDPNCGTLYIYDPISVLLTPASAHHVGPSNFHHSSKATSP
ncbi:hypothetical protein Ciccas_008702 [Cichlidogyrus casuarinus]|uniref:Uncharacterized protein n=1 Tax=Cichlidogyrus casuarinus TaxID=1844966 RepID=A0ABD2PZ97_9PLAT